MRSPLVRHVPIWVITVVAGALLVLVYLGFTYAINGLQTVFTDSWRALAREEAKTPPLRLRRNSSPSGYPGPDGSI